MVSLNLLIFKRCKTQIPLGDVFKVNKEIVTSVMKYSLSWQWNFGAHAI